MIPRDGRRSSSGRPQPRVIRQLLAGVQLDDGPARFDRITRENADGDAAAGSHSHFRVVLHEGRNRGVRPLRNAVGFEVSRLLRVRYGPVELPRDLRPGASRPVGAALTEQLAAQAAADAPGQGRNKKDKE